MELFAGLDETIVGALAAVRSGRRSYRDLLEQCLERTDARESEVHAWAVIDREGARQQADRRDKNRNRDDPNDPIAGIPIGVKDIINVAGLPTSFGVPGWVEVTARRLGVAADELTPHIDAPLVADLRNRGAVILGKTVSTPYAWIDPPPTRNPWNLDRTPGGSSSGSAAAVASGMCLGALGSQTGGSITRPAAFCGVCGFKPTFGSWNASGILPLSPSLDHPGAIARTIGDLALLANVRPVDRPELPIIGRLRGLFNDRAEPAMLDALDRTLAVLVNAGAQVIDLDPPEGFSEYATHHYAIMSAEAALYHQLGREQSPELFPTRIAKLIDDGLLVSAVDYLNAFRIRDHLKGELLKQLGGVHAFLTPAALGPAPDAGTTGDPAFNSPWSLVGFPTVSLPIALSPEELPLGLQVVGRPGPEGESALFGLGLWAERAIRRDAGAPELPRPF